MFGRVIWDKLPEYIFKKFWKKLQKFQKSRRGFNPKIVRAKHVITG